MIPIIKKLQKRFEFPKPIVVADAGLLSKENIRDLEKDGYEYILGARIRSQCEQFKEKVASLGLSNGQSSSIPLTASRRMVVTMSDSRAKKNAADRERGLKRLEKRFKTDKLTKDKLNNRGYNRFLAMEGDVFIKIDYAKVEKDARLDGLKGYTTNSTLSDARVIEEYGYLFMIERAFRFCKTDLDIRPMYHRLFNRIEAHVCICFIPKRNPKSLNFSISSQLIAEMGVPLRKTGKRKTAYYPQPTVFSNINLMLFYKNQLLVPIRQNRLLP